MSERALAPIKWFFGIPTAAYAKFVAEGKGAAGWGPFVAIVALWLYVFSVPFVMVWNHYRIIGNEFSSLNTPESPDDPVPGLAYVDALLHVYDEAMHPWLPNDKVYPTILLDNPQHFQEGVLEGIRDAVRVLREYLTRQRTTDQIDDDVNEAFTKFSIARESWMLPPAEGE